MTGHKSLVLLPKPTNIGNFKMLKYPNGSILQLLSFINAIYDMNRWKEQTEVTHVNSNSIICAIL